jgi:hypothetical protein
MVSDCALLQGSPSHPSPIQDIAPTVDVPKTEDAALLVVMVTGPFWFHVPLPSKYTPESGQEGQCDGEWQATQTFALPPPSQCLYNASHVPLVCA